MKSDVEFSQKFKKLADDSIDQITSYFDSDGKDQALEKKANAARSVLSSWARHEQTISAREATNFMMARELAQDKDQLEKYIKLSMPSSPLVKALPEASEKKIN